MINFYKNEKGEVIHLKKMEKECWIDIVNPTVEELIEISKKTNTDQDLLTKLLDDEELPRVEIVITQLWLL